jgi:tryptophan synthase alpha chain
VAAFADAVVIGSRLIEVLEEGPADEAQARAGGLMRSIRAAMDAQTRTAGSQRP